MLDDLVAGASAGVVSRMCVAPLDVVKIRLQTQARESVPKYQSVSHAFALIVREEGLLALWKGNLSALLLYLSYGAIQFSTYRQVEQLLDPHTTGSNVRSGLGTFMSGAMAGTLATVLTYPFDLFRTRFSLQGHETRVYTGLLQAFAHTWQQDGLRGFYRGLAPTVLQIIPSMGIMYYSYEVLNRSTSRVATVYLPSEWRKNQQWVTFDLQKTFCGAAAGLISKTSTMPFDVIRKRLQMQHNEASKYAVGGITSYGNVRDCIVKTYRLEGWRGFYRGLLPALLKTGPASAVTFLVYENVRTFFH